MNNNQRAKQLYFQNLSSQTYRGFKVMDNQGELSELYLESIYRMTESALSTHHKAFAFRVDLHLPLEMSYIPDKLTNLFIDSFVAKIEHAENKKKKQYEQVHTTKVFYAWGLECSSTGRLHYHFAFILNYHAFCTLGLFELGRDNLYNKLVEAWASALRIDTRQAVDLVVIPSCSSYKLNYFAGDISADQGTQAFFYRASYLAKKHTKVHGKQRAFGTSQK